MAFPDDIRHTQPVPAEWPDLLALTAAQANERGGLTVGGALVVHDALAGYDGQRLDEIRYYGLGEIALGVAKQLRDPSERQALVHRAAGLMAADHPAYCAGLPDADPTAGLFRGELPPKLTKSIRPLTDRARRELAAPAPRLTDILEQHAQARHKQLKTGGAELFPAEQRTPTAVVGLRASSKRVAIATFNGITSILRLYVDEFVSPEQRANDCVLRDIVPFSDLARPDLIAVSLKAAGMHVDSFTKAEVRRAIVTRPDGTLRFDKSRLTSPPPRVPIGDKHHIRGLHDTAIGCPALYVQRLIPVLMELMPAILTEADETIRQAGQQTA